MLILMMRKMIKRLPHDTRTSGGNNETIDYDEEKNYEKDTEK